MLQLSTNKCSSGEKRPGHNIIFSTHPYDPPSSPPPASPLPPLPEIALYGQGSPTSPSPVSHSFINKNHPVRPPRPQTSLPDLKPRVIRSPDISDRQTYSELVARTRFSPTPISRQQIKLRNENRSRTTAKLSDSIRLATPKLSDVSTFSDDVFSALPRLLTRLSPVHSRCDDGRTHGSQRDILESRRASHESPSKASSRLAQKSVARTPLFIPKTPPGIYKASDHQLLPSGTYTLQADETCYASQNRQQAAAGFHDSDRRKHVPEPSQYPDCARHKRSLAVTSFTPDPGNSFDTVSWPPSSGTDQDLTSLPRVPSDPVLLISSASTNLRDKKTIACILRPPENIRSLDTDHLATLPYSHTKQNAGPVPKTEADNNLRHDNTLDSEEIGIEGVRPLTEEELRVLKQRRILWAIATISLVVIATCGILIGIIWKLRSLG